MSMALVRDNSQVPKLLWRLTASLQLTIDEKLEPLISAVEKGVIEPNLVVANENKVNEVCAYGNTSSADNIIDKFCTRVGLQFLLTLLDYCL